MGPASFPYHLVNNKLVEARFLFLMAIEIPVLDEGITRAAIESGPKDIQRLPPDEHAIWIEDIPDILARVLARLIGHDKDPTLVVGEELIQRGKRIQEVLS